MTLYGIWRCSTDLQDQERQVLALKKAGATVIRGDKITGKSDFHSRPELTKKSGVKNYYQFLISLEIATEIKLEF